MSGDQVEVESQRLRVRRTSSGRFRTVNFVMVGREFAAIEQNPDKPSQWGQTGCPLRKTPSTHRELAQKLDDLEQKYECHHAHIQWIFEAIRQLIEEPVSSQRQTGFQPGTQEPPAK